MNSLVEFYPELLEEWDYEKNTIKPSEVSFGSHKKVWWRCKEGHSWQAGVYSRTSNNRGCPCCSIQKIITNNSIAVNSPNLLNEWDYEKNIIKPEEVSCGSKKKVWWKCKRGHSWVADILHRSYLKRGCPYCFGCKTAKENSIFTTHSYWLEEWDYKKNIIKPEEISYGSRKKVWWKCKNGHSWQSTPYSRSHTKNQYFCCPICKHHSKK